MLDQVTHSLAAWVGALIPLAFIALIFLLRWKDKQIERAKMKLVEQDEDASNARLEAEINAQRAKIGLDEKALQEAEVRMARILDSRPSNGSK